MKPIHPRPVLHCVSQRDIIARVQQQVQGSRWNLASFVGRDAKSGGMAGGLFWEAHPSRNFSVFSRLSDWVGSSPGRSTAVGVTRWVGPAFAALDYSRLDLRSDLLQTTAVALFLPLRRNTLSLRWQYGTTDSTADGTLSRQKSQTLLATFAAPINPRRHPAPAQPSIPAGCFLIAGGAWTAASAVYRAP